jgi:hypothetical protein
LADHLYPDFWIKMKHVTAIFCLLLVFGITTLPAQTLIQGVVTGIKGEGIPGVNIYLKGTYDGTSSDQTGAYAFETSGQGEHTLVFQSVGFQAAEVKILLKNKDIEVSPVLKEAINEMTAVTINAGAMEASDEKKVVVLRPIDVVTIPGSIGDIVGALQTLPGTATVGNDGRLFVRGGDATETAIFIDGLKVANAYGSTIKNVPTRTRFNPNLFKGSFFSAGGYSAEFGQALSSALVLNTVDLPLRNQGDLSVMSVGLGYSHTLVKEKNSLTVSGNYFDLSPYQSLINQDFDWQRAPQSWDAEASFRQKWGKNGLIKAYVHKQSSRMKVWQAIPDQSNRGQLIQQHNNYTYAQANFKQTANKHWSFYGGLSFSHNHDQFSIDLTELSINNRMIHGKMVAVKDFSEKLSLKSGWEGFYYNYGQDMLSNDQSRSFQDYQSHGFAEMDYYLSNRLVFRGGLRSGYSSVADQNWADPRLSLAYKFDHEGQLSLAAGRFNQLPTEEFRVVQQDLENSQADHLILNYLLNKNGRTLRAEVFYKTYKKLLLYQGDQYDYHNITQAGNGYARGLDFFYRDRETVKNTDFWVTYSFVDSKRQYATFIEQVQPSYAPRHNGSIVIKHFVSAFQSQLGLSFSLNDGYTYHDPNRPDGMNSKTKSYQALGLGWSYLPRPNLIIHFACSNALGRENIFGFQYSKEANSNGYYESLPFRQGAPRFLFLGIFLTLSKDKTANQLNNL